MERVRAAVIGTGFMGTQHVQAYVRSPLSDLGAVVDVRKEVVRRVAAEFGVPAYVSVEEMLSEAEVDAVSICTSDDQHVEPSLRCLEAGKHVLLEKPIATTMEDADEISAAARSSCGKFMVGHIVRFEPQYAHIKARVNGGELGELVAAFASRLNHVGSQEILRGRVSVLAFLGIHDFDYLLWLCNSEPLRVYAESASVVHRSAGLDVEDHVFTTLRFASGMIACVESGWILPDIHPRQAEFKLEVLGTGGMARIEFPSSGIVVGTQKGWEVPRLDDMLDREIAHFLDCILNDDPPLVTAGQAREALRISLAAQESSRTGKVVEL